MEHRRRRFGFLSTRLTNKIFLEKDKFSRRVQCKLFNLEPAVRVNPVKSTYSLFESVEFGCKGHEYIRIGPKKAICLDNGEFNVKTSPICRSEF